MNRVKYIVVAACVGVSLFSTVVPVQAAQKNVITPPSVVTELREQILLEANLRRAENGFNSLTNNAVLLQVAQEKAQLMALRGEFNHILSDGTTAWSLLESAGYQFMYAGENLAVYFVTANDVMDAWYASPTHRENLLSTKYTVSGVGVARGTYLGNDVYFMVQLFARPF